ncbi:MAG: type II secretion system minor pseudopilin GspJ [Chromatiales bacterium]|nr:type II secretion system minor pseudopilin GspJ [Chromatiales bacterium]
MRRYVAGFTLLEVMVSVASLSLLAALAHGGLVQTLATHQHASLSIRNTLAVQRGLSIIDRDLAGLAPRSVTLAAGQLAPAFVASDSGFEFSRDGYLPAAEARSSSLQRVRYLVTDGALVRQHWNVLDRAGSTGIAGEREVLQFAAPPRLRFLTQDGVWLSDWPAVQTGMPIAIELEFEAQDLGGIRRLWVLK